MFWLKFAAIAVPVVAVLVYIGILKSDISDLEDIKKELEAELVSCRAKNLVDQASISNLKKSIEQSNSELEALQADEKKLQEELEIWKNKPEKIVYKTQVVEKLVKAPGDNYTEGMCLDFMKTLSTIKYGDL